MKKNPRWRIYKDGYHISGPITYYRLWLPWIIAGPDIGPKSFNKVFYTITDLFDMREMLWHAQTHGGDGGLTALQFARFPTYEAARSAFATFEEAS